MKSKSKWFVIIGFLAGVAVLIVSPFSPFSFKNKSITLQQQSTQLQQGAAAPGPSPSVVPYQELTIPYLRSRNYQSSLGNLTKLSENAQYISYVTSYQSDGLRINGLLTVPQGEVPESGWPAVVFIHGYIPPNQYSTTERYGDYVDYLARNGFVVFKIDLRGHGDSDGQPGGAYYSSGYIVDTLNAYAALESADFVNSEAIGLWGHSMAGNVVLRSLATKPEIPAAVIWAGAVYSYEDFGEYGISDFSYQRPDDDSPRRQQRQNLFDTHGRFDPGSSFWQQVAPTNYLTDLKGAIQIHHATNDNVVDIGYSRNLNELLNNTAVPHQLFEYTNGGHNLSGSSFVSAMRRTVDFYSAYLTN